jgi:uncharacterized protein (DUF2236 family)
MERAAFSERLRAWAQHVDPVAGFFGPGSTTWKVNREAAIYLGGMRALLMQIAHPKVAQGVADHSNFRSDPFARLRRTFDTVHAMVFGTREQALVAAERLYAVHERVRGNLAHPPASDVVGGDRLASHGPAPAAAYSANDPDLLLWVFATLVDSSLEAYETFFAQLSGDELQGFYEEAKTFARLCGLEPHQLPPTLGAFRRYVDAMIAGREIEVTPTAREIADALLKGPPLLWLFRPSNYVLAAGMLPGKLREQYALSWTLPVRAAYHVGVQLVRRVTPHLPPPVRYIPSARKAERRCAARPRLAA